jgi:alpha/beta superfamily hydrolase
LRDGVAIHCLFGVDDFYWTEFVEATEGRLGVHINEFTNLVEVETIPGVLRGFPSIRVQNLAIESVVAWVQEHTSGREFKRVTGGGQHTGVRDHGHGTEEVVFFGTEPRMYGVTHLPAGDSRACVVICSSTHAELQKTYRHEAVLARALATRGFAVQRFHYKGTGNSEGDISELTFPAMIDAGRQATERIVDLAKAQDVVFVGVRLGAYPAISLAAEFSSTSIVFWDPVLDADRFMKEALRSHAIAAIRAETKPETVQQTLQRLERDGWIDLLGFEMTSQFHASIKGKKLIDYSLDESEVLIVPFGKLNTEPLVQAWSRSAVRVTNAPGAQRTAWWLAEAASEERMKDGEALAHRTADWISAAIPH